MQHLSITTQSVSSGTYGKVTVSAADPSRVVKRTKLFDKHELVGANLAEAAFVTAMMRTDVRLRNHINVNDVVIDGKTNILIEMERGNMSLYDWIYNTPYPTRVANIRDIVRELATGLYDLHEHGLVHCDMKPNNVVVFHNTSVHPRIIDFGSIRYIGTQSTVVCTYPFCAPEVFLNTAAPNPACDAYSLGALIHFYVFKTYLYDVQQYQTYDQVLELHKTRQIIIPQRPLLLDQEMYDIMCKLLHPDPEKRLKISTLYHRMCGDVIELVESPKKCLDPRGRIEDTNWNMDARAQAIDDMSQESTNMRNFTLAVNILDRYVDATGSIPDKSIITACVVTAEMVLQPDWRPVRDRLLRKAIISIVTKLKFTLFTETADVILMRDFNVAHINYYMLKNLLKQTWGKTSKVVAKYRNAFRRHSCKKKKQSTSIMKN